MIVHVIITHVAYVCLIHLTETFINPLCHIYGMNANAEKRNIGGSNNSERNPITPDEGVLAISNALSISMLPFGGELKVIPITLEQVKQLIKDRAIKSYIGHPATAKLVSGLLGVEVPVSREMFQFNWQDNTLIVFTMLVRLQENRELSEAEIKELYSKGQLRFYIVEYMSDYI